MPMVLVILAQMMDKKGNLNKFIEFVTGGVSQTSNISVRA